MFLSSLQYRQYFCALTNTLLIMSIGMHVSWTSPTIPQLTSPESPIGTQLTKEQASWIASAKSIGMLPSALIAGVIMDKIGRKKVLFLSGLSLLVSWIIMIFSMSLAMLLTARVIGGFGAAITSAVAPIYIGEVSEKTIRGRLITITMIGSVIASAIVLGVGPFVSFKVLAVICALPSGIFCAIIYFAPESPYYLIKINKRQAASDVLKSLSKTQNSDNWLKEVETSVQQDEASKLTIRKLFLQTNYRNALLHVIAVKSLLQFGGYYAITAYLQTIMEESHTSLSAETSSVIFAVVQIPCVLISAYLIDTWGRRPLLMMSSAGCAVALIGEGTYFYLLQTQNVDLSSVYFLPTLFLVVFYIMLAVGIGSLPYVISGELFASNVKKIGGSMFAFYSGLLSFVNIKVFNPIAEAWGMHAVFWIFAGVCMCGIFYGLFVLPETKGKTFEEIQRNLGKKEEPVKKETSN